MSVGLYDVDSGQHLKVLEQGSNRITIVHQNHNCTQTRPFIRPKWPRRPDWTSGSLAAVIAIHAQSSMRGNRKGILKQHHMIWSPMAMGDQEMEGVGDFITTAAWMPGRMVGR